MLRTRWHKVLRDLWFNKTRATLVILSIAVGVFSVGAIASSQIMLSRNLAESYNASNPAHATIITQDAFGDDLVSSVRNMRQVAAAEARGAVNARLRTGPETWQSLRLVAVPDYEDMDIDKVRPEQGAWPPPDDAMLIERSALGLTQAQVGDMVRVKTPDDQERDIRIAGLAHDLYAAVYVLDGTAYGFINFDTLEWLGQPRDYNELRIRVARQTGNRAHIKAVANEVQDQVEEAGHAVLFTFVPEPGEHPLNYIIQAVSLLLGVLGVLALFLSGFLVVNIISALLAQQTQEIGIMKAVGARTGQVFKLYLLMVIIFGVLALVVAVPLGAAGSYGFTLLMAGYFNFDITYFQVPLLVLALEVGVGLLAPVLAGFYPILAGTRLTVRQAINEYGLGQGRFGASAIDRWLSSVLSNRALERFFSRPLLISLRNTFRRKKRLLLTLTTLVLAGAIFIGIFSVYASSMKTLDQWLQYFQYDISVLFNQAYRAENIEPEVLNIPGVSAAESWGFYTTRRVRPDGSHSANVILLAPPANSTLIEPSVVEGRWLLPEDEKAVVINTIMLRDESNLAVGDEIVLKIEGDKTTWTIVGITEGGSVTATVFINYVAFSRARDDIGTARWLAIETTQHSEAFRSDVAQSLETYFDYIGLPINMIVTLGQEREEAEAIFQAVVALLLVMAALLAVVGGMGLTGTMSINVLERRREIGVMRSIGASNGAVLKLVMVEGMLIGLLSWLLAMLLAIPLSGVLSYAVGQALLQTPFDYAFSIEGALLWLALVVVISLIASYIPARNASRLTVREVLAYE
ncbi:MAG: ABC transporter permease [Anaerolineae bacterium]|nr:ABC transporter permease [Anaerolineae bacterium]